MQIKFQNKIEEADSIMLKIVIFKIAGIVFLTQFRFTAAYYIHNRGAGYLRGIRSIILLY